MRNKTHGHRRSLVGAPNIKCNNMRTTVFVLELEFPPLVLPPFLRLSNCEVACPTLNFNYIFLLFVDFFLKIFSLKKSLISHPQLTTPSQPMDTDTPKFSLLGVILRVHLETAYLTFAKNMLKYT